MEQSQTYENMSLLGWFWFTYQEKSAFPRYSQEVRHGGKRLFEWPGLYKYFQIFWGVGFIHAWIACLHTEGTCTQLKGSE